MRSKPNLSWRKQDLENLHHSKIFQNYNTKFVNNPWYVGLTNTFLNSVDFVEESDRILANGFNKTRELGHFDRNFYRIKSKQFPHKQLDCGWTTFTDLSQPDKTTGVGLRRIKNGQGKCGLGQKRKFHLETIRRDIPKPTLTPCFGVLPPVRRIGKDANLPCLPKWALVRPDLMPSRAYVERGSMKPKNRPKPERVDCWIKIPYTLPFFHNTRKFEIDNYLIFQLLKLNKGFLNCGEFIEGTYAMIHGQRIQKRHCSCPTCQKANRARTIVDATTSWLGFTNKEIGTEKLAQIVSVFTGNENYQECYSIEEPTKAIIAKQIPPQVHVIIGNNGTPVSHVRDDFSVVGEMQTDSPFSTDPEYNKNGREVIGVFPTCNDRIPLSWDDQVLKMTHFIKHDINPNNSVGIRIGEGKSIRRPNEDYIPNTVARDTEAFPSKKYLPKNPTISQRSILEIRDWFSFCKLTRSLIRSTPHFTYVVKGENLDLKSKPVPVDSYDAIFKNYVEQLNNG